MQPNQFNAIPRALSPAIKAGIPLEIWTETSVQGDTKGSFNVASSDRSTVWVQIENEEKIIYKQQSVTKLDSNFFSAEQFSPGKHLVNIIGNNDSEGLFYAKRKDDSDPLQYELDVPKALQGLI